MSTQPALGTIAASEHLIRDLYLDIRERTRKWASVTKQTSQARMGYVGQHLVSVVTGFPGGKSGARGYDILYGAEEFGEIKTCYRIDQLGKCGDCGAVAAPDEQECSSCGSKQLVRNDDSKWLIAFRNEQEFAEFLKPRLYYLVLFEFKDLAKADYNIIASVWQAAPRSPGFALCLIDYYLHIRSRSSSKAPFNLWPHSFKFALMNPLLIYQSETTTSNVITTRLFPTQPPEPYSFTMHDYSRSKITNDTLRRALTYMNVGDPGPGVPKELLLELLDAQLTTGTISRSDFCDKLAIAMYANALNTTEEVPGPIKEYLQSLRDRPR